MRRLSFKDAILSLDVHIRTETYEYKRTLVALMQYIELMMIGTEVDRLLSGVHSFCTPLIFNPLI